MSPQNVLMAKKSREAKPEPKVERKPYRWARVRDRAAEQLDKLVDMNETDFTEEVNAAVREYLEKRGLWPIPPGTD